MKISVLPTSSRALLESCRRLGIDGHGLLAEAGIDRSTFDDPDVRLTADQADGLWRAAMMASRDPHLALRAAEATPFGAYRAIDYLGVTGATVGEGLRRVADYFSLIDPRGLLRVVEESGGMALTFTAVSGVPLPQEAEEYTLGVIYSRARHAAASEPVLAAVRFTFPRPDDVGEHARVFGVEPSFGARTAALVFPKDTWDAPTRMHDPGLFALLDGHARILAERDAAPEDLAARVRAAIGVDLPGREPTLAGVARRLVVSGRTLQRRLEAAGTSFARLVDDVRRERAEGLLQSKDVAIAEVSWLVGFSEQSGFTRAFRRWTGTSPTAYRRRRSRSVPHDRR